MRIGTCTRTIDNEIYDNSVFKLVFYPCFFGTKSMFTMFNKIWCIQLGCFLGWNISCPLLQGVLSRKLDGLHIDADGPYVFFCRDKTCGMCSTMAIRGFGEFVYELLVWLISGHHISGQVVWIDVLGSPELSLKTSEITEITLKSDMPFIWYEIILFIFQFHSW